MVVTATASGRWALKDCIKGSFLEGLDDFNIEVMYRELAANSVAFMLMTRVRPMSAG